MSAAGEKRRGERREERGERREERGERREGRGERGEGRGERGGRSIGEVRRERMKEYLHSNNYLLEESNIRKQVERREEEVRGRRSYLCTLIEQR